MSENTYGADLRKHRRQADVTQAELAEALGFKSAVAIHRRETSKVQMDAVSFAQAIDAVERIVEERQKAATPADVLAE